MFSKDSDGLVHAQSLLETIARSFLRGSAHGNREARNRLGDELVEVTKRLPLQERVKLAQSIPSIVAVFPPEARSNFDSFLDAALEAAEETKPQGGDSAVSPPSAPASSESAAQPRRWRPATIRRLPRVRTVAVLAVLAVMVVLQQGRDDRTPTAAVPARHFETPVAGQLPTLLAGEQTIAVSVDDGHGGYRRQYPKGRVYATVTGFTSSIEANGLDAWLRERGDADPGAFSGERPVHTTVVPAVQEAAVRGLGSVSGAVVAIDPATGHILALASAPGYDPNLLADPDTAATASRSLHADVNKPLTDRATAGILAAPGEVFEVVTAAAALSTGAFTADTQLPGSAALALPGTTARLANRGNQACSGTGVTSLADALRTSCTTAFAGLGMTLGGQALREQAEAFGIGPPRRIPVEVQASSFPQVMSQREVAWAAVGGFDVRITPLQLAMIGSGIANQGKVTVPTLLADHVGEPSGPPGTLTATTPEVAGALAAMMRGAVVSGPAQDLAIPGLSVAGLLGDSPAGSTGVTWATAFSSAGGRSIAVAVALETHDNQTLSARAAAVAREVIRAGLEVDARS